MKKVFLSWAVATLAMRLAAQPVEPVKLAVIAQSEDASAAADILTAQLSASPRIHLLERNEIQKIYQEQALSRGNKDYLKLGQILGADGILVLKIVDKEGRLVLSCRLVAVKPGVDLGTADYDFPLAAPADWSRLVARHFEPLLPKLAVLRRDAVPVSILNLRSAIATPEGQVLERQLTLLLHDRLMSEPNLFVLERRSLETLAGEKEDQANTENPFWNGSYLVEGTINPRGFNGNTITVAVQINSSDKKKITTVEVSGQSANLAGLVNDLAVRIADAIHQGGATARWNAADEADRYFHEAQWMLQWGMGQEARTASEAAWALGRQTHESAELRIKAYQACARDPGICTVSEDQVVFVRYAKENSIGVVIGEKAFASAPDPEEFRSMVCAAGLWLEETERDEVTGAALDNSFLDQGATLLDQCSWWLRYYYFNTDARTGLADELASARQLCREMAQQLKGKTDAWLRLTARHEAFWAETPDESLRVYQQLIDSGQWPANRIRFFNNVSRQVTAEQDLGDFAFIAGHRASDQADACSPCLAGWDWETRQRCPALWGHFIDQLCASSKPAIQLEGLILRCSYEWSDKDFQTGMSQLEDHLRQEQQSALTNDSGTALIRDLQALVDFRVDPRTAESHPEQREMLENWEKFRAELETSSENERRQVEADARHAEAMKELEAEESYLEHQTNFDFSSFVDKLLNKDYDAETARQLQPHLTNYQARVEAQYKPSGQPDPFLNQTQFWIAQLDKKLKDAISGKPPPIASSGPMPAAEAPMQYGHPGNQTFSRTQAPATREKPVGSIKSLRFWTVPSPANSGELSPAPPVVAESCYCAGRFWVETTVSELEKSGQADFYGIDLDSFNEQHVTFTSGDQFSFWVMAGAHGENRFQVDPNYIYLWLKDGVRRYSFADQTWQLFTAAGGGHPQRLGNRLFFTSSASIQEYLPDGTMELIASCRRGAS